MASMTTSMFSLDSFNLVTFVDTQESYCHLNDIDCPYIITEAAKPDSSDLIGIFKVGWKSTKEYVCSMPVALPADYISGSAVECKVKFEATRLPQDDSEFYQFCYISNADQRIRGVSSPFQFVGDRSAIGWEMVDKENFNPLVSTPLHVEENSPSDTSIVAIEEPCINEAGLQTTPEPVKENEALMSQIDELKQQLLNKQKDLETVCEEKEQLKTEYASAAIIKESALGDITQRYNDVTTTLEQTKQSLLQKETEVTLREEAIKALEKQLAEALAERDKRETEFSMLTTDFQTHESKFKELEADASAQLETLKLTLQHKEDEGKLASEAHLAEVRDLTKQLADEKAKSALLEEQLKALTEKRVDGADAVEAAKADTGASGDAAAVSATEGQEEQFHDAFELARQCPICTMAFPADWQIQLVNDHVLAHIERLCPVCEKRFPPDTSEHDLVRHVELCLRKAH